MHKLNVASIALALLACAILTPRVGLFGSDMFTLDDVIPLLAGVVGGIWVLRSGTLPRSTIVSLLLAWMVIGFLSVLQNTSSIMGFASAFVKGVVRPLNSLLIFAVVHKFTYQRPQRVRRIVGWIVGVGTFEGGFAVVAYTWGLITNSVVPGLNEMGPSSAISRLIPGRFVGTPNMAGNFIGAYFLMTIPLTLAVALTKERRRARRWYVIALALQLFGMIATFTRASFLGLIVALLWMLVLLKKKRLLWLYLLLGGIVALIIVLAIPEYVIRYTADETHRQRLWTVGLDMTMDYPILGVGPTRFMEVVNMNPQRYPARYNPHNWYIMMGAEGGIGMLLVAIGLAVFSLFHLYRACRRNTTQQGRVLLAGILTGTAGFLLQNLTNDLLHHPSLSTYYWLFYVLGMNMPGNHSADSCSHAPARLDA